MVRHRDRAEVEPRKPTAPQQYGAVRPGATFHRDKLCWHEHVIADARLVPMAKLVAGIILHDLNARSGQAWRSQAGIAMTLRCTVRTVQNAISQLVWAGYLQVLAGRGPSNSNRYIAVVPHPDRGGEPAIVITKAASSVSQELPNAVSPKPVENANVDSRGDETSFALVSSNRPLDKTLSASDPAVALVEAAAGQGRNGAGVCTSPSQLRQFALRIVGSEAWIISYFDPCTLDADRRELVPLTETARQKLTETIGSQLSAWGWTINASRWSAARPASS